MNKRRRTQKGTIIKKGMVFLIDHKKMHNIRWAGVRLQVLSAHDYEVKGKLLTKAPGYSVGDRVYFQNDYLLEDRVNPMEDHLRSLVSVPGE